MPTSSPTATTLQKISINGRWDEAAAGGLSPEGLLLHRSNLLGSDRRITNFGGGNTSAKLKMSDPLTGNAVEVLWVKGSGGDLGTLQLGGFATLYMDKLLALPALYQGHEDEERMVGLYPHCTFNLNPRPASIDTPLHAFIDQPHVDHMHPDAVIAIAASVDGRRLTREIYGDDIGWLPWLRPGFELGLRLRRFVEEHPHAKGVILEAHGLFTWGETSEACYRTTLGVINRAIMWLGEQDRGASAAVAGIEPLAPEKRSVVAAAIMPKIRGLVSGTVPKIGHFNDSPEVLDFVCSAELERLASIGTSCPDHFLRTKIRPLVLPFDPEQDSEAELQGRLPAAIAQYRDQYRAYYERCKRPDSPMMRDPNAVIYLVRGVGMIAFGPDKGAACVASEFYVNAINVMRESSKVSSYQGLPEQEAFDIEYWSLEEAKLKRMPKPKALAGRIALITGGAGGIGLSTARRLMDEGACAVLCDTDRDGLQQAELSLQEQYGKELAIGVCSDVTDEHAIADLFQQAALCFGGIDICVSNAGIASAAPIEETSLELWQNNLDILATGYFLVSREAVRLLKLQGLGGSIVFIGSKNALVASPGAAAYCAAKASELHLARCLALELAPDAIRVNVVNPDAVLRGSHIWRGEWAEQRANHYNTSTDELEKIYRERSLLKRSVFPEDVAESVAFFASERSCKSTGNILNVDAGHAAAFTR